MNRSTNVATGGFISAFVFCVVLSAIAIASEIYETEAIDRECVHTHLLTVEATPIEMVAMHSRDHADGVWRLFFYDGCGREVMVLDATISDAEAMSLGNACHTATFKGPEGEVQDFSITPTLEINLANAEVVTQRFYDTYYFREALGLKDYGFKPLGVEYGSSTGKLTGLFNGEGYEVYYYNPWGLECQRVASGFNVGRRTTKYNFDLSVSEAHTTYDGLYPDRDVYYSYDDCGRKTQMLVTEHRTRDGVAHTDSATIKYEYGPTGLMEAVVMGPSRKKITYDIHGWQLKAETELKRSYNGNYVERLYYADTKAAHPRYNGFVSCKEWQRHAYDYDYDANGFLKKAVYSELPGNTQATGANQGVRFDRSVSFEYDVRGNVKKIQRKGAIDRHPSGKLIFGLLDDIAAAYTGNRLTGYSYQSGIPDATFGRNRVSGITELYDRREDFSGSLTDISDDSFTVNYKLGYDASGRLTGDTSRGVKDAQYDNNGYLTEVTVGGCSVKYRRDDSGNLLSAEYTTPDGSGKDVKGDMSDRTVLYDGDGHMSVNGTLEMSRFEGGYFDADGKPHYYLTDYQGNVVRVIDETGLGGQPMDYYPYGEPWQEWDWARADTNSYMIKNRFLYGGKERITQFGLGLYNFEARMYRAQLGRFSTPDKKAIDTPWLSPFAYCANNPVNLIDPTGMIWEDPKEAQALSNRIDSRIKSCNDEVAKLNEKLKRTDLSQKSIDKYNSKIADLTDQICYLEMSKSDIELLGKDPHIFVLSEVDGEGAHMVRKGEHGKVIIETSQDALTCHEMAHVRQSLNSGGLSFSREGKLRNAGMFVIGNQTNKINKIGDNEVEAYRIQYSVNPSSMPLRRSKLSQIDVDYVGNLRNANGTLLYPQIHKK